MYNREVAKQAADTFKKQFEGQREDEELLLVFRRHIIAMRKGFYALLIPMVLGAIPFLVWQDNIDLLWVFVGSFALGLMLFSYHLTIWFYTYFIVTNQRIRQVTQRGFFGKDVVELRLSRVQNISYNVPGFFGEAFKFGTIVIQTIVGDLVIRNVESPDRIYNSLQDAVSMYGKEDGYVEEGV